MGTMHRFAISLLAEKFGLETFIETGTATGESLAHVAASGVFKRLLSCEIEPRLAAYAMGKFASNTHVSITRMDSELFMRLFSQSDLPPALVFLDAHYPGAGYGLGDYAGTRKRPEHLLPLRQELICLTARPPKDVIIIDDLRIYEINDYEDGPLPDGVYGHPEVNGSSWIVQMFPSHSHVKILKDQGYLVLQPRTMDAPDACSFLA